MKFYTNKYPIKYAIFKKDEPAKDLETGCIFTIDGINGDFVDLKPVSDIGVETVNVSCKMLEFGFTESDRINL